MICSVEECENQCEGRTTQCASHNFSDRKAAKEALKEKKIYTIPKVSKKMSKELKTYSQKRKEHLKKHPYCQLKLQGCTGRATEIHHSSKRGINLNNEETFLSGCNNCHHIVETQLSAKERRERGFLK